MRKMNTIVVLLAFLCALSYSQALAHGGVSITITPPVVTIGGPPPPPPVVVAPAPPAYRAPMVEYRYYPAWNIYFDPYSGLYWSQHRGAWVLGPLPARVYYPHRLGGYVVIPAADGRPWHHYPPRGYRRGW